MHLQLASTPRAVAADGAAATLAPRDAALLAWLALEGPTSRARLAQLLWPSSQPVAAGNALRQRLFHLRRQFGRDLVVGGKTLEVAPGVSHDLLDSDRVLGEVAHLFGGEFDAWLAQQRGRRRARLGHSLIESSERAERSGSYNHALAHAQELLSLEPLSEAAHRRAMRLHYLAGDRAAALLAFDRCEQMLKDEVGAAPSHETLALLATVSAAQPPSLRPVAQAVPASVLRPPRLIGRDGERQVLARAVDGAALVLLLGEAGMGKSRLIADVIEAAAAVAAATGGAAPGVVSVGARPGDAAVPYAVAARWLRALLQLPGIEPSASQGDDLAAVLPELGSATTKRGADHHSRLRSTVQALLASAVERGLRAVVIDDLQYADTASVELLHPLVGESACGWIVATRPDELGAAARALVDAHAGSAQAVTVQLHALDTAAIATLLESLHLEGIGGMDQAESLRQRTGGNPLYLLETLKAALAARVAVPPPGPGSNGGLAGHAGAIAWPRADNVLRLIQQRLLRLAPLALKLARCAAIAGQDMSPPLAAAVLGLRPLDLADAWAELETAQVLRDGEFAHDLIAEATLALVPRAIARTLHAEIAGFLEGVASEPFRIAAHWLAAGEPRRAAPHLNRAARRAHAAWQRGQAADLYEQAAAILRDAGDRRGTFDALFAAAEAASQIANRQRLPGIGQALQLLADDDGQRAAAALVPAFLLHESGQLDAARRVVLEALPQAQRADLADIEVELLWNLTNYHMDCGELADAKLRAEQALQRLAAVDPATARLSQLGTRFKLNQALGAILSSTGHYEQGDRQLLLALQQARLDREWAYTGHIANELASNALEQGSLVRALDWSAQAIADDERFDGGWHARAIVASGRASVLCIEGALGGALVATERAVQMCEPIALRIEPSIRRRLHALQFELGRRDLALKGLRALRARDDLSLLERVALEAELLRAGEAMDSNALLERIVCIDNFPMRVRLLCQAQSGCEPLRMLPLLGLSAAAARDQGAHGLALTLQTRRVAALRLAGRTTEAQIQALAVWQRVEDGITGIEMFPRLAAELCAALAESHADLAQVIALRASAWMQQAAATLPAEWRRNYLVRAPILETLPPRERGLLTMARP